MEVSLNCSLALAGVLAEERPRAARELGYTHVEYWWPFETQEPTAAEADQFVDGLESVGLTLTQINFPGGGPLVGDRGLLSVPGREEDFLRAAEIAVGLGARLGTTLFNPMVGNAESWGPGTCAFETAVANLVRAAPLVAAAGGSLVIEPLSGFPSAAVKSYAQAVELVWAARSAGAENVAILFDLYHLAVNEDPVLSELIGGDFDASLIANVQLADVPGRGWPGTGTAPLTEWVVALRGTGYEGRFGFECAGAEPLTAAEARNRLF